ncbi:MAG: ATP-binding protein [Armatimonadia bacterium]
MVKFDAGNAAEVVLDLTRCSFIGQTATAVLGAIVRRLHSRGVGVFATFGGQSRVEDHLRRNGFLHAFGWEKLPPTGHAVPYRQDKVLNSAALTDYLMNSWIGTGWVDVSESLSRAIAGAVCEIYMNAHEHSESSVGVFSCGQHYGARYGREAILRLAVVDLGIGIVENVRRFAKNPGIKADDALRWAFYNGSSTKHSDTMRRGLGLGLLRDFVQVNGGSLQLHTNDGQVMIRTGQDEYATRTAHFGGTVVVIEIVCDERHYHFKNE